MSGRRFCFRRNRAADAPGAAELAGFADYFDGTRARVQRVALEMDPGGAGQEAALVITLPEGAARRWPLSELRRPRDQAGGDLVLTSAGAPMARLLVAEGALTRQLRAHAVPVGRMVPVAGRGRIAAWGTAAVGSVLAIVFLLVPLMADQLAPLIPPGGEKALGDTTFEQIRTALTDESGRTVAICDAPRGTEALELMVDRFRPHAGLPYPLSLHVLDHPMVNAFALPGGHVVLFRGLIEAAGTPEELAAVLAHELGHVAARDPTRAALRTAGSVGVLGLLMGDFAGGTLVLVLTERLIEARYSRDAELAADAYSHDLLTRAGLPPGALGAMFERMRAAEDARPTPSPHDPGGSYEEGEQPHGDDEEGSDAAGGQPIPPWRDLPPPEDGGSGPPDDAEAEEEGIFGHFSSHPALSRRIRAAREADRKAGLGDELARVPLMDSAEWRALRKICR